MIAGGTNHDSDTPFWNEKNYIKLTLNDAKRQLGGYVDWFFERECKMSCKVLRKNGYCTGDDCAFEKPFCHAIELPYTFQQARQWLEHEFSGRAYGYVLGHCLDVMLCVWNEKGRPYELYIGLRTIQAILFDKYGSQPDTKSICRQLHELADAGFLEISRGQSGSFGFKKSNGYRFLPWVPKSAGAP